MIRLASSRLVLPVLLSNDSGLLAEGIEGIMVVNRSWGDGLIAARPLDTSPSRRINRLPAKNLFGGRCSVHLTH